MSAAQCAAAIWLRLAEIMPLKIALQLSQQMDLDKVADFLANGGLLVIRKTENGYAVEKGKS